MHKTNPTILHLKLLAIPLFLALLVACTTPVAHKAAPGPVLPDAQRASLTMASGALRVFKVDGESTAGVSALVNGYPREVSVLPGMRSIWVGYEKWTAYNVRTHFCLNAEAGGKYIVKASVTEERPRVDNVRIWIEDQRTGLTVGKNTGRNWKCN